MVDLMQQVQQAARSAAPDWLAETLNRGQATWRETRLPTRKTEAWKYNDLKPIQQTFEVAQPGALPELGGIDYPKLDGSTLVFADGVFREELSRVELPAGATLTRFSQANEDEAQAILARLGSAVNHGKHLFASLNDATLADGVFLRVAADVVIEQPVHLVWLSSGQPEALGLTQRLLLDMGAHSQVTLVESFAGSGTDSTAFTNGISEILLGPGAQLEHSRLHLEQGAAVHIGGVHALLAADANLNSFHFALGSQLKRIDVVVELEGEGAHCDVNGIYLPRGEEQVDYHTCMEHAVPNCSSRENFRGIVGDSATAIFNGRIHIHPDAQKTRAELSNKNLLTSRQAEVNTKPELEIYADDVQCAHGATVAQMDATALHYLRTRGVGKAEAEVMLSYGFVNELVESLPCVPVRDYLKALLVDRLTRNPRLTRHLS